MQLEIVKSDNGAAVAVYLDEHRIAGEKPWGGGTTWRKWDVSIDELQRLIDTEREKEGADCDGDVYEMIGESLGRCVLKAWHRGGHSMAKNKTIV